MARHESSSNRRGSIADQIDKWANSITIESYLEGLNYPASRQDIVDTAKSNGAPDDVLATLRQFSDRMYNSPVDVSGELGVTE